MSLVLHGYWRSGTSHRVRIGLNLKGLAYETRPVNLLEGEHRGEAYRRLNPQALVPALEVDGAVLTQSSAILEWLEEVHPSPPLLPAGAVERAQVRAACAVIGADTHPIHNMRVGQQVKALGGDVSDWNRRWLHAGMAALEPTLARRATRHAFGEEPGLFECYLPPLGYAARRFEADLAPYPRLRDLLDAAEALPAVAAAHPDRQPDARP